MHTLEQVEPSLQEAVDSKEQTIRERAYQIYEIRGREDGHADEDWYQAELELRGESEHKNAA